MSDPLSDINRSLPFSDDAEKGVISCFLQNPAVLLDDAATSLPPGSFYHPVNRMIFEELQAFNNRPDQKALDLVTFSEHLNNNGLMDKIGGPSFITELLSFVPTPAHYPYYKGILKDKFMLRSIITACTQGIQKSYESEFQEAPTELLNRVDEMLLEIRLRHESGHDAGPRPLSSVLHDVDDALTRAMAYKGKILGIRTGIPDLDRTINGLESPDVFFIAARPGMGKTNLMIRLMINMAVTQAADQNACLCFSLEMSSLQLIRRALLSEAGVEQSKGRTGMLSREDQKAVVSVMGAMHKCSQWLHLDDTPELTISEIRSRIRQMKRKHDIKVVFLDYAQIVQPVTKRGLAEERLGIAEVCGGLKAVAKQCKLVIIVLAQAGRGSEKNPGGRPELRDLDGSSAIEKWADFVAFIHRPSKYKAWEKLNEKSQEYYGTEQDYLQSAELLLRKGRECGEANIPLRFIGNLARFEPVNTKTFSNNPAERQKAAPPDDDGPFSS